MAAQISTPRPYASSRHEVLQQRQPKPITATFLGAALLGEPITGLLLVGLALVLSGIVVANLKLPMGQPLGVRDLHAAKLGFHA